jgi:hypothetical protein
MDDRDLLTHAAQAAGLELRWSAAPIQDPWVMPAWTRWNPLKNDADAFRLAVQLGLELRRPAGTESPAEACAATRRAIVQAAAQLASRLNATTSWRCSPSPSMPSVITSPR